MCFDFVMGAPRTHPVTQLRRVTRMTLWHQTQQKRGTAMTQSATDIVSDVVPESPGGAAIPLAKIGIGLGALLAIFLVGHDVGDSVPRFAQWVEGLA